MKIKPLIIAGLLGLTAVAQPAHKPDVPPPPRGDHHSDRTVDLHHEPGRKLADFAKSLPEKRGNWLSAIPGGWKIHFSDALREAQKQNKPILILKTGSDWCGFCIRMKDGLLSTSEFRSFAKRNLILLYLDFPNRKRQSRGQLEHNKTVSEYFEMPEGFPAVCVISPEGRKLGEFAGYNGRSADYMEKLRRILGFLKDPPPPPKPTDHHGKPDDRKPMPPDHR